MHRAAFSILLHPVLGLALIAASFPARILAAPVSSYRVVAEFPHSIGSYTEGFFYRDGFFYEGTGLKGSSAVLVIEPETGHVVQRRDLPQQFFGEGIIDWGPNIYEWTWQSHICFVFDRFSLRPGGQFTYSGEGWGMTRTAREIITSDGTATLRFRDPKTFKEVRHVVVKDGEHTVQQLNELEYVKGEIYANIWHSDRIARISPRDGHVIGWIDLTGLMPASRRVNDESVLNGIAYDAQHDRLFVTGKQWPVVFEIKVVNRHRNGYPIRGNKGAHAKGGGCTAAASFLQIRLRYCGRRETGRAAASAAAAPFTGTAGTSTSFAPPIPSFCRNCW
jgi:glutamine cyclotransferase